MRRMSPALSAKVYPFVTALGLAVESMRAHKLRSFLTLLGVIIGVGSVVLVGAAIDGLGVYAEQSTAKAFGTDSYLFAQIAVVGNLTRKQFDEKRHYNRRFQKAEVDYLRSVNGETTLFTPYENHQGDVKGNGQTYESGTIIGSAASLPDIRDILLSEGRFFTEQEEHTAQPVAVIGQDIKDQLFPQLSALGKTIKISGVEFTVIGLQEKLGSAFGNSQDNSVYIPFTTFGRLYGTPQDIAVFGRARPSSGMSFDQSLDQSRAALRAHFHAKPGAPDNFDALTPDSIRSFTGQILGVIAAVVVPVTAISLVVGGIVIMNIMLVSVTERTREIGVRKSLGARHSDVMLQFLMESVVLSFTGGALGVLLGFIATRLLSLAFGLTLKMTLPYIFLSLFVSTVVGVVSGWYPAKRAAQLDPIVALRAE
jgi:putative ABC transport system permease protein